MLHDKNITYGARFWLKITFNNGIAGLLPDDSAFAQAKKDILTNMGGTKDLYLPLTGEIPNVGVENTYESLFGSQQMDLKTRFAMTMFGAGANLVGDKFKGFMDSSKVKTSGDKGFKDSLGSDLNAILGGIGSLGTGLSSIGDMIAGIGKPIDMPKMWNGFNVSGIELKGTAAFENFNQYKYFNRVMAILYCCNLPSANGEIEVLTSIVNYLKENSANAAKNLAPFSGKLTGTQLSITSQQCNLQITCGIPEFNYNGGINAIVRPYDKTTPAIGNEGDFTSDYKDVAYSEETPGEPVMPLYLSLKGAYISKVHIGRGEKGTDNFGIPRVMEYALSVTPLSLMSVIDGLYEVFNRQAINNTSVTTAEFNYEGRRRNKMQPLDANGKVKNLTTKIKDYAAEKINDLNESMNNPETILRASMYQLFNRNLTVVGAKTTLSNISNIRKSISNMVAGRQI